MTPSECRPYLHTSEVCDLIGESRCVVKKWVEWFGIKTFKDGARRHVYTREQAARLWLIKMLLREEGFTIRGAKKQLKRIDGNPG